MKFLDRPADALLAVATQQLEGRSVHPEDDAVRPDLEQTFERVLEKVAELAVAIREHALRHDAPLDFPFQRTLLRASEPVGDVEDIHPNRLSLINCRAAAGRRFCARPASLSIAGNRGRAEPE